MFNWENNCFDSTLLIWHVCYKLCICLGNTGLHGFCNNDILFTTGNHIQLNEPFQLDGSIGNKSDSSKLIWMQRRLVRISRFVLLYQETLFEV